MKIGQVSKRIGVSTNTLRYWANEYSEYLSETASGKSKGAPRLFSEADVLTLNSIKLWRADGLTPSQIEDALKVGRLAADTLPEPPDEATDEARKSIALIPMPEYQRLADLLRVKESEITRVQEQYERGLIALQEANDQIAALREQVGELRGKLGERMPVQTVLRIAAVFIVGMLILLGLAVVFLAGRGG